jgi:small subunit ribosomal protein S16
MVVIRLARGGSKKRPKYRITVADSRQWVKGRFLEIIGNYNPSPRGQEQKLVLDIEKANAWIKNGAQPTERVKSLLRMAQATKA